MLLMRKRQSFINFSVYEIVDLLSIIPPYDKKYVPQAMAEVYPKKLSDFYDPLKENSLNYLEVCNLGNSRDIDVSPQQESNVEKLPRA